MLKKSSHHETAKGVIGLLIVAIGFVLFYKLYMYQEYFAEDPTALRNYVMLSIVAMGFLTALFYLVSQSINKAPVHKATKKKKSR